jgi:hypothetical protein
MFKGLQQIVRDAELEIQNAQADKLVAETHLQIARSQLEIYQNLSSRFSLLKGSFSDCNLRLYVQRSNTDTSRVCALKILRALGKVDNEAVAIKYEFSAQEIAESVLEMLEVIQANEELSVDWKDRRGEIGNGLKEIAAHCVVISL